MKRRNMISVNKHWMYDGHTVSLHLHVVDKDQTGL